MTESHDDYRIALYYCYVPIENVDHYISVQRDLCVRNNLMGRIRVSPEGMNGVLSGLYKDLLVYQQSTEETLDIKYCRLRSDLPVSSQLFTSLSIKATREVVGLYEPEPQHAQRQGRRKQQRKRQGEDDHSQKDNTRLSITSNKVELLLSTLYEPAPHVSPHEWNDLLLEDPKNTILLDARNVYESRVGHFRVEGIPTLLTNTRKYSNLPRVLEASRDMLAGKRVFMYCTGGVRCERASVYLQALFADAEQRPTQIYQLDGGIQRYLEQYGNGNKGCLYSGKNFVFDPRRTDPVEGMSCAGRCLLCDTPHDDYDNGHAPCEHKEARCGKCRVLVLVCNSCRSQVRSWGEPSNDNVPDLYCGGSQCIGQGNAIQPTIV